MDKLLLRIPEAAEMIAVSRARLYELMQAGEIPSVKLGRSRRIPREGLEEWVAQQVREQEVR